MSNPFEGPRPEPPQPDRKEGGERELTPAEMREKLHDPSFLPSYEALSKHFEKFGGFSHYDDPEWKQWHDLAFGKENPIFEIWTKEYIHAFGSYLAQRVEELGGTEENPTVILEVGAGNGRLTHFLQEKMNELIPGKVKVVASDSGDWKIPPTFPVENISHNEAFAKHKPKIVIFSWMPYQYDCTSDFRAAESVDEYILIGEADGGCCGDEWQTWGQNWTFDEEERERRENQPAPYEADGFEKVYQNDLSDLQLSRINISEGKSSTSTVSFKKKK
jgi:hypothetical protein